MIERIGLRAAEFVGSTARRVGGAAEELVNDRRTPKSRLLRIVAPAVAAGAAAVAATASAATRNGAGASTSGGGRTGGSGASRTRSGGSSGTGSRRNGSSGNGGSAKGTKDKVQALADKSREELYEIAKKADLPGRSSMSKDELAKALSK